MVLCFSVGFEEGSLEMSDWLEQPEEGGVESEDQMKGKEAEEEEQGKLLASIEVESSHLETELKGLMRQYVLMLFQRERKGELLRVEKKQKELNTCLGELRRARDLWLEADKDKVTVVDSNEDRSGGVDLLDLKVSLILLVVERESELERALQLVQAVTASQGWVIKFIHQFRMVMLAHAVSERDQKSYLLEVVHKTVTERLLVEGIENSLIDHLLSLVKILLLGPHWERLVLDKWQGVRMVDNESVFRFCQRVQMFNDTLSHQPMSVERNRILIDSELRLKFILN